MKKALFAILAAGTIFMGSCSKTGPQGPEGPMGNANVIGEDPFYVNTWQADPTGKVLYAQFVDNNITADVANYGMVEIYKYYPNVGWTNLPDIDGVVTTVYNYYAGGFTISILTTDGTPAPLPAAAVEFRAVVIPSSVRHAYPHTNWHDYVETTKVLNDAKKQNLY